MSEFALLRNYRLDHIFKVRDTLNDELIPLYRNKVLSGKLFQQFVTDISLRMHKDLRDILSRELDNSLRYLLGKKLSRKDLEEAFWRLAGNEEDLRKHPVPPWQQQVFEEWVPIQVIRVRPKRGGRRGLEVGHELVFKVLAGSPCPLEVVQWWSSRHAFFLAFFRDTERRGFGFQRNRSASFDTAPLKYPFLSTQQFFGLRCLALMSPKLSTEGPDFETIAFTSAMHTWNVGVQKARARLEPRYACKFGFPISDLCHTCPVGLDRCPAAVHNKTYEFKTCGRCGHEDVPHDPEDVLHDYCIGCVNNDILSPEKG